MKEIKVMVMGEAGIGKTQFLETLTTNIYFPRPQILSRSFRLIYKNHQFIFKENTDMDTDLETEMIQCNFIMIVYRNLLPSLYRRFCREQSKPYCFVHLDPNSPTLQDINDTAYRHVDVYSETRQGIPYLLDYILNQMTLKNKCCIA